MDKKTCCRLLAHCTGGRKVSSPIPMSPQIIYFSFKISMFIKKIPGAIQFSNYPFKKIVQFIFMKQLMTKADPSNMHHCRLHRMHVNDKSNPTECIKCTIFVACVM